MKKILVLLGLFIIIAISGCATEQGGSGGYERLSGGYHGGHH